MSTKYCADDGISFLNLRFENDVNMYGTQTITGFQIFTHWFENDVNMYGTQTKRMEDIIRIGFENDVNMYGTQTSVFIPLSP